MAKSNRTCNAKMSSETLRIINEGQYIAPSGLCVHIAEPMADAIRCTQEYPPGLDLGPIPSAKFKTRTELKNESTLSGIRRLAETGVRVAALNFASAKRPGGGFLSGAEAQEESLARSSGLYACLRGRRMYSFHKAQRDFFYSDYAIYSPNVPVIRDDSGQLLEQPHYCSFITCPAVNAGQVAVRMPEKVSAIPSSMETRVARILTIAAIHGHEALVLGAWGCGVFKNDHEMIARLFRNALSHSFRGVFETVVFSVLDRRKNEHNFARFQKVFEDSAPATLQ